MKELNSTDQNMLCKDYKRIAKYVNENKTYNTVLNREKEDDKGFAFYHILMNHLIKAEYEPSFYGCRNASPWERVLYLLNDENVKRLAGIS